ncbi:helix-turn-helix domain-containing protein [Sphingobacterium chuzhouense]|uniref:Helix-turn-helix transcriptional regulator n=1 Tax=Sphingobacterium chuzhouense TaxID=1742264 RepID=A0ABR7XQR8_9SPHI|nr:AraC family transcriptional regulator [Sphingobacterium chuzhouense]MBD1421529.1 helix-turn-helix transcriptional regulator [Sphingobacterium chuzhouense]
MQRLDHTSSTPSSIAIRHDNTPQNHNVWHYHEELEFIYIKQGKGTFFVGDCIQQFADNFIVLIGSKTPHYWLFDEEYMKIDSPNVASIHAVHFKPDFIGSDFLGLPEAVTVKQVYRLAKRAILFPPDDAYLIHFFENLSTQMPTKRLIMLLDILDYTATLHTPTTLVSANYTTPQQQGDYLRMNKILDYIRLHYKAKIHLDEIAHIAGMTSNSFCRYFKQRTGKTLIEFVNELRIGHACKLLSEGNAPIKEICFECGFHNFVSFHKIFKSIAGSTPSAYREAIQ